MLVLRPSWPWQLPRWPCRWRTGRRRLGNGFPPPATERVLHLSPARPSQLAPTCQCLEPPAVPPEQLNSALVSPPINRSPPACRPPPQARWRSSPAYLHADEGGLGVSLPPPWPARRHLPRTIPIRRTAGAASTFCTQRGPVSWCVGTTRTGTYHSLAQRNCDRCSCSL
ncbi:hypothetical protein SETIT_4G005400v2 [Setaria italica]|uniref:Uncharacterized protein n=1 Tax=Setaria italica TaxID=4555 RepID=A0A368QPA5_SETIT|nr:hypothetical protein SETIT_4G005400v2 [Setaria italica]